MAKFALDLKPGLIGDDTSLTIENRWRDGANVRWNRGKPQVVGGWESLTADLLTGVCRTVFSWSGLTSQLSMAFGTHSALMAWVGGELEDITPVGLAAGQIDGTGGAGYGTGGYGIGGYGDPSTTDYFPRTWSFGAWGTYLIASPRGGKIYEWRNVLATPAAVVTNAPLNVTYALVAPQDMVFALGCNEEVSTTFNPLCIRHSSVRNNTEWNTAGSTTAREYILPGGGRIVAGRVVGSYLFVWTDNALFLGTYVGALDQPWRFDRVGLNCGLIGPNAAVIVGQTAYWFGTDRQFRACTLGGVPSIIDCPLRSNMDQFLAASQADKIVASSTAQYNEIRFDYPNSEDGYENSRYLSLIVSGPDAGAWSKGDIARTAYVDAGPSQYPCGVTYAGNAYWHERGTSADGSAITAYLESGDLFAKLGTSQLIRGVWPDFIGQVGNVDLTLYTRQKPQQDETTWGPFSMMPDAERVDFRAQGAFLRTRFDWDSTPAAGRIGTPVFDITTTGRR